MYLISNKVLLANYFTALACIICSELLTLI